MTSDHAHHAPAAATARISPAFHPGMIFTSMLQVGEFMVRAQARMFSAFLGIGTTNVKDTGHDGLDDARSTDDQNSAAVVHEAHESSRPTQEEEDVDTHQVIAARAQEIAASPHSRGELDNWLQAERELSVEGRNDPA